MNATGKSDNAYGGTDAENQTCKEPAPRGIALVAFALRELQPALWGHVFVGVGKRQTHDGTLRLFRLFALRRTAGSSDRAGRRVAARRKSLKTLYEHDEFFDFPPVSANLVFDFVAAYAHVRELAITQTV
jgi:hypothetical protein